MAKMLEMLKSLKRRILSGGPFQDDIVKMIEYAREKALAERDQPPFPMPHIPPDILISQVNRQSDEWDKRRKAGEDRQIRTTFIGQESFSSMKPLSDLKPS